MSSAAVTPTMRALGWNIEFLATCNNILFAGTFQPHHHTFMSFRDILNEMRLCFEIPRDDSDSSGSRRHADAWDDLAFGLAELINISEDDPRLDPIPTFVNSGDLDQQVPALPQGSSFVPEDRPVIQYRVFCHQNCGLSTEQPLTKHFQAGCARHIPKPVRRVDSRYLPPKKTSSNPRFAAYPLRKTARPKRGSQSPSKRSASGSVSPSKDPEIGQVSINEEDDLLNMVAPPQSDVPVERARQTIAAFRSSCLVSARQCAISGMGRSWCVNPSIGPALQACHIIPQQHYHLYPDPEAVDGQVQDENARWSSRRLMEAWERTWSPKNGILLLSHLHELFDARLFSIHPTTLQIRAFVPYDVILQYHGHLANVPRSVDRAALRHHYEMCCIENMAAEMAFVEQTTLLESAATASSNNTPFEIRSKLAKIPGPGILESPSQSQNQDSRPHLGTSGDPTKRAQNTQAALDYHVPEIVSDYTDSSTDDGSPSTRSGKSRPTINDWASTSHAVSYEQSEVVASGLNDPDRPGKRGRSHSMQQSLDASSYPGHDSYITPHNKDEFLADVNWELIKVARRRIA